MSPGAGHTSDISDEAPGISASASSASLHHPEVRPASPSPSQRSASRVRYRILRVTSGFTHCCPLSGYNTSDQHSIKRTYFADSSSIYPGMRKPKLLLDAACVGVALLLPDADLHDLQHLALSQRLPRSSCWVRK